MRSKKRKLLLVLLAAALVVALSLPLLKAGIHFVEKLVYPTTYQESVTAYAKKHNIPESLIFAIIHTESHFDSEAISKANAKGLMQLTDSTCEWARTLLGEKDGDVFDPETNIRYGTKILSVLGGEFSELETVLAAYNAGIGNVRKWLDDPRYSNDGITLHTIPFKETREYVVRVLKAQKKYQTLYDIA